MKKRVVRQFMELLKRSFERKPKTLDPDWRAIHAIANVLFVRYALYVKSRKNRKKAVLDLKEWIKAGKPAK